ncbi:MarR family transcriptional regulator [Streptomyces clavuligerus]|uniref:Putative MarR-family transcriptional regulator n=2 Tax=Streptomyces clavuligerus TaxID=1901 RepID=E2PYD6_STRCL|nr:MarR family transcriptional regulator [Streptomyces clavuligerus]EFG06158.1 Putative MarR-family transcriptional regulator [Streptomyces clavuligerus]MBY6305523.1 MarR family transcriptional regulator [Streptomyces clavuligerus]QCS09458.1 MarR family transcriptional regulator [Streptomyces clavuligerus]QPJ96583.1 MarR family transcriptional regulator [Streptomyces clavuligerus]
MTSEATASKAAAPEAGPAPAGECTTGPQRLECLLDGPASREIARISRLHRLAAAKLLRGLGLYPGQEILMTLLWERGPVRQSELIRKLELDPSTVTKMLQRLEQSGQVRRSPDPADRRAALVEATERGHELREEVERAWARLEEQTLAGLADEERAELIRLLGKVSENLCAQTSECSAEARNEVC